MVKLSSAFPAPWRIIQDCTNAIDIVDASDHMVMQVLTHGDDEVSESEEKLAKFIVRIVNDNIEDLWEGWEEEEGTGEGTVEQPEL